MKYKSITVYNKKRQGEVLKSWYQKELFTLNMFTNNKQNKLRLTKKDEIKGESYLYSHDKLLLQLLIQNKLILFFRAYVCFILDLRRDSNKNNCANFKLL